MAPARTARLVVALLGLAAGVLLTACDPPVGSTPSPQPSAPASPSPSDPPVPSTPQTTRTPNIVTDPVPIPSVAPEES